MSGHTFGRVVLGAFIALGACVAASSCGSDNTSTKKAVGCTLNSDCDSPLICVYQRCHQACGASSDCPDGQRCVAGDSASAAHVCQLPVESSCASEVSCTGDQLCSATDQQCRTPCHSSKDCVKGDYCESEGSQSLCFVTTNSSDESVLIDNGVLEAGAPDSSMTSGGEGGSSGVVGPVAQGGTGGAAGAESSAGGASDDAGTVASVCTVHFGAIAIGDTIGGYLSGVGTRTPKGLLLLDGYAGPGLDGGSANRIDVQSFDVTGVSKAAAAPAIVDPTVAADGIFIKAATTSPDGITAVVYTQDEGNFPAPKIAFLAADLTPIGLPQSLGPNNSVIGQPDMQWVKDRFVIAFAYNDGSGAYAIKVQMFGPDGVMITGIGPVPTDDLAGHIAVAPGTDYLSLAASGTTIAVAYHNVAKEFPMMSLVDLDANPIGEPIQIAAAVTRYGLALAGTAHGFVAVWHEYGSPTDADAGLFGDRIGHATFISVAGEVGSTIRLPGGVAASSARGSSDGTRAAFALLYAGGVTFGSATDDLSGGFRTSSAIPAGSAVDANNDEISISNSASSGSFGVSYYSRADHRTRAVAEACTPVTGN